MPSLTSFVSALLISFVVSGCSMTLPVRGQIRRFGGMGCAVERYP
jgi:hypothetical protein